MRILSSQEARLVDQRTIKDLGIPGETLMAKAGLAVAEEAKKMLLERGGGHRVAIICGRGNNGGDGYAAAPRLQQFGADVALFSTVPQDKITGDAGIFHWRCVELKLPIQYDAEAGSVDVSGYALIVDGLLGTGVKGNVRPGAAAWIEKINGSGIPVLSVDIPSGVSSDSGQILGAAVRASNTVTMGYLKQGLVMNPGAELAGSVQVADLEYPDEAFATLETEKETFEETVARSYLTEPPPDTYKHRQGKVLVLAGSRGFTGAMCLVSMGALRAGAGLVVAGVPESLNTIVETKLTEVITAPVPDNGDGSLGEKSLEHLGPQLEWCHVVAIGPGLGTTPEPLAFARALFDTVEKPLVLDADALRVFRHDLDFFKKLKNEFIITPHHGEAAALFDVGKETIVSDPFDFVHESSR
ncbi:MAG: NAD(P)H-hydrate epimerase, partial [Fidelibacterota bacterium]